MVVVINDLPYQINLQNDQYGACPTTGGLSSLAPGYKPTQKAAALWLIAKIESEIKDGHDRIKLIKAWMASEAK